GGHLSSLPAALPSDHDDHHGGVVGRIAVGPQYGDRLRAAAALGCRDCRRSDLQSAPDIVYDTGDLSGVRPISPTVLCVAWPKHRRTIPTSTCQVKHEFF